ncbi:MAG TPA: hypothetical protein VL133_09775 [Devosia sp.]|nr:hypothetical protein [Devosia sp.]
MKVRARAPLRLGLAGGGTDLELYSDEFGGAVLNATIARYAHASLTLTDEPDVVFLATDMDVKETFSTSLKVEQARLKLHLGVYRRITEQFLGGKAPGVVLETMIDAPPGSGLGSSSALVVAMVEAFRVAYDLPLGPYDVAQLAYDIERSDLGLAGGKQDQYAAAFGGVNFIEFLPNNRVLVNPLRLSSGVDNEMQSSIVVCFTGASRASHDIIIDQVGHVANHDPSALEGMHQLKRDAVDMKAALLRGDFDDVAVILNRSWIAKKATARSVSNPQIDALWTVAMENGAKGGKISGAGGGGFIMFLTDPAHRSRLMRALKSAGGEPDTVTFSSKGVEGWIARS